MSKWTFRLIGLGVVVALSAALFKTWFLPKEIPLALQKEISIQVNKKPILTMEEKPVDQKQDNHISSGQTKEENLIGDKPPGPPITLISYDSDNKKSSSEPIKKAERPEPIPPQPKEIVEVIKPQSPEQDKIENNPVPEVVEKKPAPEPEEPAAPPPKPEVKRKIVSTENKSPPPRGGNWVQAGAFSSQENTRNFVARLRRKSWPVTTEDAVVNGKLVHRVLIGPLSPNDVEEYINILGKMGFNARHVSR